MRKNIFGTHLCGSVYSNGYKCEHLLYANKQGMIHGKKDLKYGYVYCTADGKCRSLGCVAAFTGNSPTFCPKRKEIEENDKQRAFN